MTQVLEYLNSRSRTIRISPWLSFAFLGLGSESSAAPLQVGEAEPVHIGTTHPYRADNTGSIWRYVVQWPGASYIALHFQTFELASGDYVTISDPEGVRAVQYTHKGKEDLGNFWATHIPGDTAIVELHGLDGNAAFGFVIDQVAHGYPADELSSSLRTGEGSKAICGSDDSDWAQCFLENNSDVYWHARAVARLLINGTVTCTGWLVGDEGHLMTNNHCISNATDALNTDYEFRAEGTCTTDCSSSMACPGDVVTSEATLVRTSDECDLDYTLVKLSVNPTSTYGFLTVSRIGALEDQDIYIAGHPAGWGKRISLLSTHPADPEGVCTVYSLDQQRCDPSGNCGGDLSGPLEVGYMCDTQAGSSGSPVLRRGDNVVVALHHCADCPNRGEQIQAIIDDLGPDLPLSAFLPRFRLEVPALTSVGLAVLSGAILASGFLLLHLKRRLT